MTKPFILSIALLLSSVYAHAQGSKADYERTAKISKHYAGKIHKNSVKASGSPRETNSGIAMI